MQPIQVPYRGVSAGVPHMRPGSAVL